MYWFFLSKVSFQILKEAKLVHCLIDEMHFNFAGQEKWFLLSPLHIGAFFWFLMPKRETLIYVTFIYRLKYLLMSSQGAILSKKKISKDQFT